MARLVLGLPDYWSALNGSSQDHTSTTYIRAALRFAMIRESLAVVILGSSLAGCLGPVPITLPSAATAPSPQQGPHVSVAVSDDRSEQSVTRIGVLLGGARDFVIEGDAPLAARLEDEVVNVLRSRGYRCDHARDADHVGVAVVVRIVRFASDVAVIKKVRFQGRSVLVTQTRVDGTSRFAPTEVIEIREERPLGGFTRTEDMRKLVAEFFHKVAVTLADSVSAKLPSPRGGS
jgi:uncharacterized lipoprotein YajG